MGILYGYRETLGFLSGIAVGFFLVMLACAYISSSLLALLPDVYSFQASKEMGEILVIP